MREVVVPTGEMNRFDLPAVCLVTGAEEGVAFHPMHFGGGFAWGLLGPAARGELPFTAIGWRRHRLATALWVMVRLVFGLGAVGVLIAAGGGEPLDAGAIGLATAAVSLCIYAAGIRGRRVTGRRITPTLVRLEVPSASAAETVTRYRRAGKPIPIPAVPV